MKITTIGYMVVVALLSFGAGTLHSCMERDRRTIVTPKEVKIEPFEQYEKTDEAVNFVHIEGERIDL